MTVHRRLTSSLGFILRHFRWVPHLLSDAQKVQVQPVELSLSLLQMLEVQQQRAWHDIVTWMSRDSVIIPTVNRFGFDRVKKFPRGHMSRFNAKINDHHCLESHGIPRKMRSSKGVQIQQQLLLERNTWATLGVAK
jgi:hypothetical protein